MAQPERSAGESGQPHWPRANLQDEAFLMKKRLRIRGIERRSVPWEGTALHVIPHLTCDFPRPLHVSIVEYEPMKRPNNYLCFVKGTEGWTGVVMLVPHGHIVHPGLAQEAHRIQCFLLLPVPA
ncbi:hypothetical protein SAY86_027403 [Trapa natans]|uniref:Uncharacterized protein n=1 Tax=Trapa natans TaxID=22666 RepID=A0AAN7KRC2_TRANT|nr:hypothetical protein SAY86_027403 [Trapa natans]